MKSNYKEFDSAMQYKIHPSIYIRGSRTFITAKVDASFGMGFWMGSIEENRKGRQNRIHTDAE